MRGLLLSSSRRPRKRAKQWRTSPGRRSAIDEVLMHESEAVDADLIVMGGYGRARLHEMLLGGVTRSMVRASPIPLLLSR